MTTSLSSVLRRVKALIKFHHCPIRVNLLRPNSIDSIFALNNDLANHEDNELQLYVIKILLEKFPTNIYWQQNLSCQIYKNRDLSLL